MGFAALNSFRMRRTARANYLEAHSALPAHHPLPQITSVQAVVCLVQAISAIMQAARHADARLQVKVKRHPPLCFSALGP
jgi:hypothetical protein